MGGFIKLAVSAAILALLFVNIDVGGVLRQLAAIEPLFVVGSFGAFLVGQFLEAVKLRVLLPDRPLRDLFAYTMLVQLYALVLPGQLAGEAVKTYRLCRSGDDGGGVVSAVVFDKVTGLIGLLALTLAGVALESHRFGAAMTMVVAGCLTAFVAGTMALASGRLRRLLLAMLARAAAVLPWLARPAGTLRRFLEVWQDYVRQPRILAASLALGAGSQFLAVCAAYLLALGLGIELGFPAWWAVFGVMSLVVLAPITIGGLGLREASLIGMLGALGIERGEALALALAILGFKVVAALLGAACDMLWLRDAPRPEETA